MITAIKNAFLNMMQKPYTHSYPAAPIEKPKDYRGLIEYDADHCIFCDKCEKVCPPGAIIFKQLEDGSKRYNYNPHLCIYCGDCVRDCPKIGEALWQSEDKALPALKVHEVNDEWYAWEKEAKQSREDYKAKKALERKAKAAAVKKEG